MKLNYIRPGLVNSCTLVSIIFSLLIAPAHASTSLGCNSKDGDLSIIYMGFEGDGLGTALGNFSVSYRGKSVSSGILNWFKLDKKHFRLIVFSLNGRQVNIEGTSIMGAPGDDSYRVDFGSIEIDGRAADVKGAVISCAQG